MSHSKLLFGIITETQPDKGLARVEFTEDGIITAPLPYLVQGSTDNKFTYFLPVGTQVACLMDSAVEDGLILGTFYNDEDLPDSGAVGVYRAKFSDGAEIEYNTEESRLSAKIGTTEIVVTPDGVTIKRGGESLKSILSDLIDTILQETHTTSTGPSGPPINATAYTAIKNRLPDLFQA